MTSPLRALLWAKLKIAWHNIAAIRKESWLKISVVSISAILLWLGAFIAFREGFEWLRRFDLSPSQGSLRIGDIVMLRMISVFSLALFLMLIFSNIFIVFSTLYRSREVTYLIHTPVTIRELFLARFVECVVFSSWASAYLGSPLILAYGFTMEVPWVFYLAGILFYIPFVTIPAALGALTVLIWLRIYPIIPARILSAIGALLGVTFFLYIRSVLNAAKLADDVPFQGTGLETLFALAGQSQSIWLPSYWTTQGLILASTGNFRESGFFWFVLVANALFFTWLATEAAESFFYDGWSWVIGKNRTRIRPIHKGMLNTFERLISWLPSHMRALAIKDIKLFWRDPTQWTQFTVFFGIMTIYAATLRNRAIPEYEHYRTWIAAMNIAASVLILATLTSRFVFPLISLEGRRFWIVGLAPLTFRQLLIQKFLLSVATTSFFTIGLVVLSCWRLQVEPAAFVLAVYTVVAANFGLAGMAVGLGSLYANFQEENPARIVSGLGGTLNFLMSVAYIVLLVIVDILIIQRRVLGLFQEPPQFQQAFIAAILFITGLTLASVFIPLRLGYRHLINMEF